MQTPWVEMPNRLASTCKEGGRRNYALELERFGP